MAGPDPVLDELPWLRTLARRLANDDAEDLVQDAWMMAQRDHPRARGLHGLRPWLARRIARERAGQLDPPAMVEERPVAERFARRFFAVGDGLEAALAVEVGADRARELRLAGDGWPGLRTQSGARCRD